MRKIILALALLATTAQAGALDPWSTWQAANPYKARQIPPAALVARGIGTNEYYVMEVNATTGKLPVDVSATLSVDYSGAPGAAIPTGAALIGGSDSGTLRAVHTDSSGDLQVDVLTSALPSGAATAAKQPALGTAGTASADVITVQGIAGMTAVKVDGSAVTQPVSAASLPLPTGAATSANQSTANTSLASIDGKLTDGAGTSAAALRVTMASDSVQPAGRSYADSVRNDYSSVNVTTGAWVQLIASTAAKINALTIFDSCGEVLELGTGAAAAESRVLLIPPGGFDNPIPLAIAAGTRVAIRAVSANCTAGQVVITGLN